MISQCPHCRETLPFTQEQKAKLEQALAALAPGKLLTLKCPLCSKAVKLDNKGRTQLEQKGVQPPSPPNLEWLTSGAYQGEEKVEDVPTALLLYTPSPERDRIVEAIESIGYQIIVEENTEDAMERMRFVNVACVIYEAEKDGPLDSSTFHRYMRTMSMERRRYLFYILIGSSFNTLYNIEALAHSANLVINAKELEFVETILRKSIPEYEELFGPLMEEMGAFGKR